MKPSYSTTEAAARAGVSVTTLYREMGRGALQTFRIGRRRFVAHDALNTWLASLQS